MTQYITEFVKLVRILICFDSERLSAGAIYCLFYGTSKNLICFDSERLSDNA